MPSRRRARSVSWSGRPTASRKHRGAGKSSKGQGRGGTEGKGAVAALGGVLGRVVRYGEKLCGLWTGLEGVRDGRVKPRVPGGRVARSFLLLMVARLGSLNAMEQRRAPHAWVRALGGALPSADVMGDVAESLDLATLRRLLRRQHGALKRNKGFDRGGGGRRYLVLDGHEGVSSYRRKWEHCLERNVHCAQGVRPQYYFRYVAAYLTNGRRRVLLDAEAQQPGEDEIACAKRLLVRVFASCPRAFDVVCGDNLYMNPDLWKLVRGHGKHIIAVLKNEDRDVLQDARSLFTGAPSFSCEENGTRYRCWDLEGFTTWPQCGEDVRVVRSREEHTVHRQQDDTDETCTREWFWVTSLPADRVPTRSLVRAGHGRWHIENYGFNELCNQWHGDHAYRYHAHALLACILLLFLAYNLFHAFYERNLKPQVRQGRTRKVWADLITAEFTVAFFRPTAPT